MMRIPDIKKVRRYFCKHQGEEKKIADATAKLLSEIDKRKNGTTIGKHVKHDYLKMLKKAKFPAKSSDEDKVLMQIASLYDNTGNWAHPQMQVNVVPPPTRLSIACAAVAARYNENSIWDHYGTSAAVSEVKAVGMLGDLIGFSKSKVGGVFTFGGTGCNLYAARIGIEKADPDAKSTGIRDRVKMFCSELAHYSIKSSAIWTGLGMDNVVSIGSKDDNTMDVGLLEKEMKEAARSGCRLGTIYATMGTTDAFG
ncbi:hypothetical protein KY362_03725, partial [Candidatus Woesearchaeota archaeon]|nr:hypothetical protein [Candidatus Woesearchaeota archaeon]